MPNSPVAEHQVLHFTKNVELLLQQKHSYLKGSTSSASYQGKAAQVVLQYGDVEFEPLSAADYKGDTVWSDIDHQQRWVFPSDFDLALPLAHQEQIRMITDPRSSYAEAVRAAYARMEDDIIVAAALGEAKVGPYDAMTSVGLPSVQVVDDGGVGLTLKKLLKVKEMLDAAETDPNEERFIALTSRQVSDLLNTEEVASADYNTVRALARGEIDSFMGFKFKRLERLPESSGVRSCFAWVKSGLHAAAWDSLKISVDLRPDKRNVWQLYARATLGATRTQEKKVVMIDCLEA